MWPLQVTPLSRYLLLNNCGFIFRILIEFRKCDNLGLLVIKYGSVDEIMHNNRHYVLGKIFLCDVFVATQLEKYSKNANEERLNRSNFSMLTRKCVKSESVEETRQQCNRCINYTLVMELFVCAIVLEHN
jgi:hypothetical protein